MKRRGLSTVVGATFFVIVMASSIGYVTYSLDLIDDLARQVDVKQDTTQNRQDEEFKISKVSVDGANEFNITVTNTGTIPINITKVWAKNMTDPSWNQTKYQINKFVSPGASVSDIGQGTGLVAMDSESYSLKLVTSRGNTLSTQLVSAANQPLEMTLFTTPANPLSNQNVTMLYSVKNNLTEGQVIQSIVPEFENPVDVTGSATAALQGSISPASVNSLQPGEVALFEATYLVTGGNLEKITFNATIANAVQGNFVTDTAQIDIAPVSESAINEVLGGQVGILSMNFTSFEACKPEGQDQMDCTSDSPDWFRSWELWKNTRYLYRLNFTNSGVNPIILEKATSIMMIPLTEGGSGGSPKPFMIREDSTTTVENPGFYIDLTKTLPANPDVTTIVYFGSKGIDDDAIATTDSNKGSAAVFIVMFAYEDKNGNGWDASDPTYAQTLPFQALRLIENPN